MHLGIGDFLQNEIEEETVALFSSSFPGKRHVAMRPNFIVMTISDGTSEFMAFPLEFTRFVFPVPSDNNRFLTRGIRQ